MDLYISTEGASIAIQKNSFLVKTKEKSIILSPEKNQLKWQENG